jgi:alpha-L-rhamnosidase
MRWWWFGPAVTKTEIERELRVMQGAGIGGVEIQPVYPLGFDNQPYLSDAFFDALRFASRTAKQLGMRVDITLGSGWPFGGPHTPVTEAAGRLRVEHKAAPTMEEGETLLAGFPDAKLFFVASRTGQQVKRASVGAEGFVLDHYDRAAIEHHLAAVGDKLLHAFEGNPPYAVFSDSLEVYGSDWTRDLPSEFERRRGYDLIPHLPELAAGNSEESASIRHDWGKTLTELAEERYLRPIADWAHKNHTLFRSQTYGEPPVILSSATLVDLPEGEAGPRWRTFNTARWASSANHLYGRNVTSSETWTWLHAPSFRATPLDMKAEADLHFIEGVNQLIGHGWPYSPPEAGEPGWRFYAAAAFNDHNPWFQVMPEIARYLQRISFLARQGEPANDIAIYLPTDDAWAAFKLGHTSVDREMEALLGPALIPQILDAGYNFDYIDDRAIEKLGIRYRVLIVPGVERMPLETSKRIEAFVGKGGIAIATRRLPSRAPGFLEKTESPLLADAKFVADEKTLGPTLREVLPPDLAVDAEIAPKIGFLHRKLANQDVYFVVNTSNVPVATAARFRATGAHVEAWNPFTGKAEPATRELKLAPYESRVLVFSKGAADAAADEEKDSAVLDLSANLTESWTANPATEFYSGKRSYEKVVVLGSQFLKNPGRIVLDFGPGERVEPAKGPPQGMRALLESPVRESALIYANEKLAGSVWHPPYEVDLTSALSDGMNRIRIEVANLAINEMAGRALPDYRLLNLRYGERFVPQGFESFHTLPAGIIGPVRLIKKEKRN